MPKKTTSTRHKKAGLDNVQIRIASTAEQPHLITLGFEPYCVMIRQTPPLPPLPPQQQRCLTLLLQGNTTKVIAKTMSLTEHTVRRYLATLRKKFACTTNAALVKKVGALKL